MSSVIVLSILASGASVANHETKPSPDPYAKWLNMPDFDQMRALLPNQGRMYCVPTSTMGLFAYLAHHGHGVLEPGDNPIWYYLQASTYNEMTSKIEAMAVAMHTDEIEGTGKEYVSGALEYLEGSNIVMTNRFTWKNSTARFSHIEQFTYDGIPTTVSVGWFDDTMLPTGVRNGGHRFITAQVRRENATANRYLGIRDPGNEQSILFNQSMFSTEEYLLSSISVVYEGKTRIMDRMIDYGGTDIAGIISSYSAFSPIDGLTTSSDFTTINILKPNKLSWDSDAIISPFSGTNANGGIIDLERAPYSRDVFYLTAGTPFPSIRKHDPVAGTDVELLSTTTGVDITFGREGQLYFFNGGEIHCYNIEETPIQLEAIAYPPDPVKAIAFDDFNNRLLAVNTLGNAVLSYNAELSEPPVYTEFPTDSNWGGDASLAVSHLDGSAFLTSVDMHSVMHISGIFTTRGANTRASTELIGGESLVSPSGINVGDDGRVFFQSGGLIKEYIYDSSLGAWDEDSGANMRNLPAGAALHIPHSRTNIDLAQLDLTKYDNVLPTQFNTSVEQCISDMNLDGNTDGADLAELLSQWGGLGSSDLTGDGNVDGADLAALLAAWGECP